jgi:hypothetical protein
MAEAGRESNERVRPQQLSLFNHRESNYIGAPNGAFFVTRHTPRAQPIRDSLNRSLLQAATKSVSRANIARDARLATNQIQRPETFVAVVDGRHELLLPQRQR